MMGLGAGLSLFSECMSKCAVIASFRGPCQVFYLAKQYFII